MLYDAGDSKFFRERKLLEAFDMKLLLSCYILEGKGLKLGFSGADASAQLELSYNVAADGCLAENLGYICQP